MSFNRLYFDKNQVAHSFSRFAESYNEHAFVQKEIGQRLLERCLWLRDSPKRILDLGSGTGMMIPFLKKAFPKAEIVELDRAFGMLLQSKNDRSLWDKLRATKSLIQGDLESIPFQANTFDLIYSNCTLQWANDLNHAFKEVARVLTPKGSFFFTTLGPGTLHEIKGCFQEIDEFPHVHDFVDLQSYGDLLFKSGLDSPVVDQAPLTVTYQNLNACLRDLRNTGARNLNPDRSKGLTPPSKAKKLQQLFQKQLDQKGHFPCTYEVIYGHAHKKETNITKCIPLILKS